jgi:hypothetical protein
LKINAKLQALKKYINEIEAIENTNVRASNKKMYMMENMEEMIGQFNKRNKKRIPFEAEMLELKYVLYYFV